MTVATVFSKQSYICNGSTTAFSFPFRVLNASHLVVKRVTISTGAETLLVLNTDYTVSTVPADSVTVTTSTAYAGTFRLTIDMVPTFDQEIDFTKFGKFPAETVERGLDKQAIMAQSNRADVVSAIKIKPTLVDFTGSNEITQNAAARSNKVIGFDAPGTGLALFDSPSVTAAAVAADAAAAASSASAAATSASNAATSASNAATSASNASTSASSAAASAAQLIGTSTTSVTIGTGTKSFVTQTGKYFSVGTWLLIASNAAPATNWMHGQVTAYSGGNLDVNVTSTGGSGSLNDWTIFVSGAQGAQGPTGATGAPGTVTDGDKGDVVVSGTGSVWSVESASGAFAFTSDLQVDIGADQNDYNPGGLSTAAIIRNVNSVGGVRTVTGLQGGADGRLIYWFNGNTSSNLVLAHDSASSSAANRILCPNSANFTMTPRSGVALIYDSTASRWRVLSQPAPTAVVSTNVVVFTASGTYTRPSNLVDAIVELVGSGGGGGSNNATTTRSSGGGAGGYSRRRMNAATIGASQTVTIGAGGGSDANGNTTSFGALLSATGGSGGTSSIAAGITYGGAGGTGSGGDYNMRGEPGGNAVTSNFQSAANGGNSYFGGAGLGGSIGGAALANSGSGGGGAAGSTGSGGSGGSGVVIITEFLS